MKKIFPHIFVAIMFFCLLALGTWQVQRRTEKQNMIQEIDAHINTPPISPNVYKNIAEDEFKKMNVTGRYLFEKEFLLLNKSHNGKPGQHVMTPFQSSTGETVLVDRGWIPTDKEYEKPQGGQKITGVIRASQKLNFMANLITLENAPQKQIWFWIDLPAIYQDLGIPPKDYYLDLICSSSSLREGNADEAIQSRTRDAGLPRSARNDDCKSYPLALSSKIEVYNEHMVYIITWYSLSIVLLLVYYFRFFKHDKPKV